ncbi:MAG: hypothetical protein OMM_04043 [Candidatus Magnetoglobus multicellularis str. Araruama]|uniref:Cohesin domain-containing protein n=1 Tax=Candidatus Magnetoglobus multicellularis str. Araruama TaxID=890399 RepID=A0A1V1P3D0_9BACT|nr:MAG: hypothetical protein OMM_04043 [Candidatus Magnetoglobus multicellularis str. Araruama]
MYIKLEGKKGIKINNAEGEEEYVVPLIVNPTGTSEESSPVNCKISWDPASFDNRFDYYYLTRTDNSQEYIVIEDMRVTKEFVVEGDDDSDDILFNLYISKFEPDFTPPIQNKCPLFTKGEDISVENNAGKQTIQNWATGISPGGEDELDQNIEFIVEFDNSAIFAEDPQISPDGTLTFAPMTAEAGTSNLTVILKDDGGLPTCDTSMDQHFSITVTQPCSTFVSLQIPDQFDTDPSSESIDLNKGDEFDIKVSFQSDMLKEILAFGLNIHFDAQLIEVLEIQDGGIFGQNQTFVAENTIDASGSVGYAVASMQAVNVDSGVFCILKCKARSKSGKACISLNSVDLSDSAATAIPHCTKNQCVEIAYPRLFSELSISNVGTGTTFSSSHAITLMSGCVGAEMKILYDPTYLEAIIVEDGPFLAQNGELISVQKEILVDLDGNPTGEILWAAAYLGDTPPEGGGVLLDIDWQVSDDISTSEELITNITIDSASFADVNGNAIPVKIQKSTEVTIEPCRKTDLNCDNKVTIFDIVLAIACYNKTAACDCWLEIIPPKSIPCIKADLNGDGKVTIFDIVLLIKDYGWKKTTSRKLNNLNSTNQTPQITIPDVGIGESFYTILSSKKYRQYDWL